MGPVRIRYGDEPSQFGELWLPAGQGRWPVVVNLHGGFWKAQYDLSHADPCCAALATRGIAVWNLEYRRVGQRGGVVGTLQDVRAGVESLPPMAPRFDLDLNRVVLMGHSAGGQLALWLAAERPLPTRGVVALAAVSDLRTAAALRLSKGGDAVQRFLGGEPAEVAHHYDWASPLARLPLCLPQRLIHGSADADVPLSLSERYVATARALGDDATLMTLQGVGHMALIDPSSFAWPHVRHAVETLL
ncbi:MAG: alpha/beta fold hydrolase [Ardenticatenales bacterium]|nr:alpha/beta fold hydrolase [Ardenticatenales bacterium]